MQRSRGNKTNFNLQSITTNDCESICSVCCICSAFEILVNRIVSLAKNKNKILNQQIFFLAFFIHKKRIVKQNKKKTMNQIDRPEKQVFIFCSSSKQMLDVKKLVVFGAIANLKLTERFKVDRADSKCIEIRSRENVSTAKCSGNSIWTEPIRKNGLKANFVCFRVLCCSFG